MKQWQITDDWSFDGLKLVDAEMPEPGPGAVLLKMKAVSLNYRDYLMVGRGYGRMSGELPLVPLSDGVGEVIALGEGVTDVAQSPPGMLWLKCRKRRSRAAPW
jgi:NADPH:quinone reductase-like Zn-dependent oxidoreductase